MLLSIAATHTHTHTNIYLCVTLELLCILLNFINICSDYKPSYQTFKGAEGESCVVDKVALYSDKTNNLCIKFLIRHTRRPEVREFGFCVVLESCLNFKVCCS